MLVSPLNFPALFDEPGNEDPPGPEHTVYLTENRCNLLKKTDDRHHQDVIEGSCTVRQVLAFAQNNLNAPLLCHPYESSRRIDAAADAERHREPSGPDADFKTAPVAGDRTTEHPHLCLVNIIVFIEPAVIVSGLLIKDTAGRDHGPFPGPGPDRVFIFFLMESSWPFRDEIPRSPWS